LVSQQQYLQLRADNLVTDIIKTVESSFGLHGDQPRSLSIANNLIYDLGAQIGSAHHFFEASSGWQIHNTSKQPMLSGRTKNRAWRNPDVIFKLQKIDKKWKVVKGSCCKTRRHVVVW